MNSYQCFQFRYNTTAFILVFSFTFCSSFLDRVNLASMNPDIFTYLISFLVCNSLSSLPPLLSLHRCLPHLIGALTAFSEPALHTDTFFIPFESCHPTRVPLPLCLGCFTPMLAAPLQGCPPATLEGPLPIFAPLLSPSRSALFRRNP